MISPGGQETGEGQVFCEMLSPTTAKTLLTWSPCAFGDYAAATENDFGEGKCYYLGGSFDETLLSRLFDILLPPCGLNAAPVPEGVETVKRTVGDRTVTMALDHNTKTFSIEG